MSCRPTSLRALIAAAAVAFLGASCGEQRGWVSRAGGIRRQRGGWGGRWRGRHGRRQRRQRRQRWQRWQRWRGGIDGRHDGHGGWRRRRGRHRARRRGWNGRRRRGGSGTGGGLQAAVAVAAARAASDRVAPARSAAVVAGRGPAARRAVAAGGAAETGGGAGTGGVAGGRGGAADLAGTGGVPSLSISTRSTRATCRSAQQVGQHQLVHHGTRRFWRQALQQRHRRERDEVRRPRADGEQLHVHDRRSRIVSFAQTNNMKVRGRALVVRRRNPSWVFANSSGGAAARRGAGAHAQSRHQGHAALPGEGYSLDVVNKAWACGRPLPHRRRDRGRREEQLAQNHRESYIAERSRRRARPIPTPSSSTTTTTTTSRSSGTSSTT